MTYAKAVELFNRARWTHPKHGDATSAFVLNAARRRNRNLDWRELIFVPKGGNAAGFTRVK